MLTELSIRDLVLIDRVTLSFGAGLNAITGETGAGKSLLVGALELLLGERARPNLVRTGALRAEVEARFAVPRGESGERVARWVGHHLPAIAEDWSELGADEERELLLSRTITADGRSRAHVNGRAVTLKQLGDLAPRVFEIHGQNDHQRLLEPAEQLLLLDAFGALQGEVAAYRHARTAWRELVDRAIELDDSENERCDRLELARFQHDELRAAKPDSDERGALVAERELLRNADEARRTLGGLLEELSESDASLASRLERAARLIEGWRARIASLAATAEGLQTAAVHVQDAAAALRTLVDAAEADPARLEAVETRLAELERLERKYSTDCAGLVRRAGELEAEIVRLESEQRSLGGLRGEIASARAAMLDRGTALRRRRKGLRERLTVEVQRALAALGLERARFDVRLGQRAEHESAPASAPDVRGAFESDAAIFGDRGIDRIEFLLAANPGEELARLRDVASGGETARIMLALRSVLAASDSGRTLIFDEIDSGVGGRLGPEVAAHLRKLARHHQVLTVTHLPAIAAAADKHLRVSKSVEAGRTRTAVDELDADARVDEIADMIAGGKKHETARAEARRLLAAR